MSVIRLSFRNLRRNLRRVVPVILVLSAGLFSILLANSMLSSAEKGTRSGYQAFITGDATLGPVYSEPSSVLGIDIPYSSDDTVSQLPIFSVAPEVSLGLAKIPEVESWAPILSAPMVFDTPDNKVGAVVFGIVPGRHFRTLPSFKTVIGDLPEKGGDWIMVTENRFADLKHRYGASFTVGSKVQVLWAGTESFSIREFTLKAVIDVGTGNEIVDRIAWVDAGAFREMVGLNNAVVAPVEPTSENENLDSLFERGDSGDTEVPATQDRDDPLAQIGSVLRQSSLAVVQIPEVTNPFPANFLVVRAKAGMEDGLVSALTRYYAGNALPVVVRDWISSMGSSAQYIRYLRTVSTLVWVVLLAIVILLLTNAMALSISDRTQEIGTQRALGATKSWVASMIIVETIFIAVFAFVLAALMELVVAALLGKDGILLTNSLLRNVFNSYYAKPDLNFLQMLQAFFIGVVVCCFASILPITKALSIGPAAAMRETR